MSIALVFAGPGGGWTAQAYYDTIEDILPQSFRDHLAGLAAGLAEAYPVSPERAWELVLTQNFATELINMQNMTGIPPLETRGCTGFAVTSPAGTFLCHNTDAPSSNGDDINVIMYWEPDNGDYAYMTMDPPGWADVAYALNAQGIGVTMNAGNPNRDARIGLPPNVMLRLAMERAATLDEAVALFTDYLAAGGNFGTGGALIHVVDFTTSRMAKIQLRSQDIEVTYGQESTHGTTYIGSANHFEGPFNPDPDYYYESSFARAERLAYLLETTATFDRAACWNVLMDTGGGDATNNTISRVGSSSGTAFGTIITAEGMHYAIGPPHAYYQAFGQFPFAGYRALADSPLAALTARPGPYAVTLRWELAPGAGAAGCNLYRADSQTGSYKQINGSLLLDTQYVDRPLRNRNRYFYKLEVVAGDGAQLQGAIVSATPRLRYLLRQ
jgi:hypothetical protein